MIDDQTVIFFEIHNPKVEGSTPSLATRLKAAF